MRSVAAAAVAVVLVSAVAESQIGFNAIDEWVAEPDSRAAIEADALMVRRGKVRTTRLYSDFILRLEFRLVDPRAEGNVFVRARFGYGNSRSNELGYRVALSGGSEGPRALGRLTGTGTRLEEAHFSPARSSDQAWRAVELRAERGRIDVSVDGQLVSSANNLDEFTGYVALETERGEGIQFRNLVMQRVPASSTPFGAGAYRVEGSGVTLPRVRKSVNPWYPREPHESSIQGSVGLEVVVDENGRAGDIRVSKPLHPDLDEAAIACARQWEFIPGTLSGRPVPVIVAMEISFQRTQ